MDEEHGRSAWAKGTGDEEHGRRRRRHHPRTKMRSHQSGGGQRLASLAADRRRHCRKHLLGWTMSLVLAVGLQCSNNGSHVEGSMRCWIVVVVLVEDE